MYTGVSIEIRGYFTKFLSFGSDYATGLLTYSVVMVCFLEDFPRKTFNTSTNLASACLYPVSLHYITHMPSYYCYSLQKHGIEQGQLNE